MGMSVKGAVIGSRPVLLSMRRIAAVCRRPQVALASQALLAAQQTFMSWDHTGSASAMLQTEPASQSF